MKITMPNGFIFEGTQSEYDVFMATLEAQAKALDETKEQPEETIEFEGEQYRKVERTAQAGDVVIFLENEYSGLENGVPYLVEDEGGVLTVDNSTFLYLPEYGRTPETVDVYEKAVADEKAKAQSKPKLKAGDFIKFSKLGCHDDITLGKAYEVYEGGDGELVFLDDVGDERYYPLTDDDCEYEILSADEAKWAKIGRKPGEFKVGDIAEVVEYNYGHDVGTIVKVMRVDSDGDCYATNGKKSYYYNARRLKLVAPVESTLQ